MDPRPPVQEFAPLPRSECDCRRWSPGRRWFVSCAEIMPVVSPHQHLSRLAQPLQRPRRPEHYDITVFKMTGHDALQGMSSHHGRSSATRTRSSQARPSSRGRARHKGEKKKASVTDGLNLMAQELGPQSTTTTAITQRPWAASAMLAPPLLGCPATSPRARPAGQPLLGPETRAVAAGVVAVAGGRPHRLLLGHELHIGTRGRRTAAGPTLTSGHANHGRSLSF
jgi:hypothetical protein